MPTEETATRSLSCVMNQHADCQDPTRIGRKHTKPGTIPGTGGKRCECACHNGKVCEAFDYHDDMYPEFAPDPIEVPCTAQATQWFVVGGVDPESMQYTLELVQTCDAHAESMQSPNPYDTVLAHGSLEGRR